MTDKEFKALNIKNRIALLEARPKDNGNIVKKLKRQYKQITGKEFAAAGLEIV